MAHRDNPDKTAFFVLWNEARFDLSAHIVNEERLQDLGFSSRSARCIKSFANAQASVVANGQVTEKLVFNEAAFQAKQVVNGAFADRFAAQRTVPHHDALGQWSEQFYVLC